MVRKNSRKGFGVVTFTDDETSWMKLARCVGYDQGIFFPEGVEESRTRKVITPEAEQFCGQCRVKEACFEFAMNHDLVGVWGGTTDYTRAQLKKNNHKVMCPGCSGYDILNEFDGSCICSSCGLSWT